MERQAKATLKIGHHWDGAALEERLCAALTLTLSPSQLEVSVDAPRAFGAPPDAPPGHVWGLWEYEVVELFLLGTDEQYLEVELGPHGHHLILTLKGVRNIVSRHAEITYQTTLGDARWSGIARLPRSLLPPGPLRANAFRITGPGSTRGYYATYPSTGAQPDFHSLDTYRPLQWS